jgi:UDP-N-acetylmuramoyl-L-alanyl-D-glutamate--2,6-diaminopimelate ligase
MRAPPTSTKTALRRPPGLRSVGVTGTNGKTTTTTWIAAALSAAYGPTLRSTTLGTFLGEERLSHADTFDGFVGVADAAVSRGARAAAIELTSQALWSGVAKAWPCDVGVFTNLSLDHLDAHGDAEHYLASKAQLFLRLPQRGVAVLNGCDPSAPLLREVVPEGCRVSTYGSRGRGAPSCALDAEIVDVAVAWDGTTWTLKWQNGDEFACRSRGVGAIFAENATAALLGSVALGVARELALEAIAGCAAPPGRFEVVLRNPHVVVDFAHTPDALARTCATARALARASSGAFSLVFGAGGERDRSKRLPMGMAARAADRVWVTADNPRREDPAVIADQLVRGLGDHTGLVIELDRRRAIESAIREAGPRDVVVVAGRAHEATQEIGEVRIPLSDVEVAREAVSPRNFGLG